MSFPDIECLVIAEAGVNHNGSLETAIELARIAHSAGADYVKYQTFQPSLVASKTAPLAAYQAKAGFRAQSDMLSQYVLSAGDHQVLKAHCAALGIGFSSTGHDLDSALFLESLGQDFVKVGSGDLTNFQLLEAVASFDRTIMLSTGASTLREVSTSVNFLERLGFSVAERLILMQCTSAYPAPPEEANIRVLTTFQKEFGCRVGYSDHTQGSESALAAVSLGACVIEKHITLDRAMSGPDHAASLDAAGFTSYVKSLRAGEAALGSPEKGVSSSEEQNRIVIRKSLYARRAIASGDIFSTENVIAKRPAFGVPANEWPSLKGRAATRNFSEDEEIVF